MNKRLVWWSIPVGLGGFLFGLDVDDIDAAFSELKNRSFKVLEEQPVFLPYWENGCKYFIILGPDGERLEFNQIL